MSDEIRSRRTTPRLNMGENPAEVCTLQALPYWKKRLVLICTTPWHTSESHAKDLASFADGRRVAGLMDSWVEFMSDEWPVLSEQVMTISSPAKRQELLGQLCDLKLEFGGSLVSGEAYSRVSELIEAAREARARSQRAPAKSAQAPAKSASLFATAHKGTPGEDLRGVAAPTAGTGAQEAPTSGGPRLTLKERIALARSQKKE